MIYRILAVKKNDLSAPLLSRRGPPSKKDRSSTRSSWKPDLKLSKILESSTVVSGSPSLNQDYIFKVYQLLVTTEAVSEVLPESSKKSLSLESHKLWSAAKFSEISRTRTRFQEIVKRIISALRQAETANLQVLCGRTKPTSSASLLENSRGWGLPILHESFGHRSWCLLIYLTLLASLILYSDM